MLIKITNMNSTNFKYILDALSNTIITSIKEKMNILYCLSCNTEKSLLIKNPSSTNISELIKVKEITTDSLLLENDVLIKINKVNEINDLIKILKYVEDCLEVNKAETISIEWSILDFENRALLIESKTNINNKLFDRTKFPYALKMLKKHHDCNYGITWDKIDSNLEEYCTFDS
jgi:hypothetical protein